MLIVIVYLYPCIVTTPPPDVVSIVSLFSFLTAKAKPIYL